MIAPKQNGCILVMSQIDTMKKGILTYLHVNLPTPLLRGEARNWQIKQGLDSAVLYLQAAHLQLQNIAIVQKVVECGWTSLLTLRFRWCFLTKLRTQNYR